MCQQQICPSNVIYANKFMCRYQTTMLLYIPHMSSLQSKLSPQALVYIHLTLLAYCHEHICLLHQTTMSHCTSNRSTCRYHITAHINQTKQWTATYLSSYKHICARNKYASTIPNKSLFSCADVRQLCQYIYLKWPQYNDHGHDHWHAYITHYWQYLLHCTCVPVHFYCSLHIDPTFLHKSIKIN